MAAKQLISQTISSNKIAVFSKSYCPFCKKAKQALDSLQAQYYAIELDQRDDGDEIQDNLKQISGVRSVPQVFINGKFFGGGDDTARAAQDGSLQQLISAESVVYE